MVKALQPNLKEAQRFTNIVDPTGNFTMQTFDDSKAGKNNSLARVFHGTIEQHFEALVCLQRQGAGVFFMVNRGDGITHPGNKTCRTAGNVLAVRSIFADLDGAPLDPVLETTHPDIVVESSPGRWHCYWLTNDCPLDQFTWCQERIAEKFRSDKTVKDLPRVMRLPGFFHQKANPFMTKVIYPK